MCDTLGLAKAGFTEAVTIRSPSVRVLPLPVPPAPREELGKLRLEEGREDGERKCRHGLYKQCVAWKEHRRHSPKPHFAPRPPAKR